MNSARSTVEDLPTLSLVDAHELADLAIELLIAALMRDPVSSPRTYSDWWAQLANVRAHIAAQLHRRIDQHVDVADVLRALELEGVLA